MEESPAWPDFEFLDHTADIRLFARGRDPQELFTNAGRGMFALIVEESSVRESEERRVSVSGEDWVELFVSWLEELLYLFEAEGWIPRRYHFARLEPPELEALVCGEGLDPDRHELMHEVKAVTHHELWVKHADGWEAQVILDI